jgi:hypothetical protein
MFWVDPTDPEVFAAVAGDDVPFPPTPEEQALVTRAVAVASELLTLATGYGVHPAGNHTEEFLGVRTNRLSLLWGPVTAVVSVARVASDDSEQAVPYRRVGQTVYLNPQQGVGGSLPLWRTNWSHGSYQVLHRVSYSVASTVTLAAVTALLTYAREIYLLSIDSDECGLPERVTSIDREGLGIQLMTPQDFLDKGRTGLPSVDTWLALANPKQASRPSQVFTPDSPPGIGIQRYVGRF